MTEANWVGDFPDGENFYQLLYGPNAEKQIIPVSICRNLISCLSSLAVLQTGRA
jgi:hypothetical protein